MDKWGQLVCTKVFILALCCHPKKAPINMPYPHTLSTCPIHTRYQYKLSTHRINTPFPVSFALHSLLSHLSCTLSTHPINAPYQRTHPISTHILSITTNILSTLTPYQHHPPPPPINTGHLIDSATAAADGSDANLVLAEVGKQLIAANSIYF